MGLTHPDISVGDESEQADRKDTDGEVSPIGSRVDAIAGAISAYESLNAL
jgi:hypothetical protein